ncbi:Nuclear nucleic acid-binding protein C1D [Plasmodiophora brassicae]|uniref:Nuclear nucleic acid-binding protein C1D n=1 Tax=Plasmodiophora brassicae TaxID=37360 RepID=A0A0G4ISF4_PLABS|nr:hypothetical protein PBRA_006185 [Plasmodiophora brassicae]SPQ96109.1 unnamed protein product [Plasmodiophora brassicae]
MSGGALDDGVQAGIEQLECSLAGIEALLEKLNPAAFEAAVEALGVHDGAKLHATTAFAVSSLYFVYLRCLGQVPQDHALNKEISRVKSYFEKIRRARDGGAGDQPTSRVDTAAAGRFVRHALGSQQIDLDAKTVADKLEADAQHGRTHKRFASRRLASDSRSTVAPETNNVLWQKLRAQATSTEELVDKFLEEHRKRKQ